MKIQYGTHWTKTVVKKLYISEFKKRNLFFFIYKMSELLYFVYYTMMFRKKWVLAGKKDTTEKSYLQ